MLYLICFSFVKKSLDRVCSNLQRQGTVSSYDVSTLKGAISKDKMEREMEWQRLHPGMDALLSHKRIASLQDEKENDKDQDDDDDDDDVTDEDMNVKAPKKRTASTVKRATASTTARGRGRGGRGRGASNGLAMSSGPIETNNEPPPSPASNSARWPPRR